MAQTYDPSQPPPDHWDDEVARALIGKTVLVGLTHCTHDDEVVRREQFYGVVKSADRRRGIALELDGSRVGESHVLPPMTKVFEKARLGDYRLSTTGETVSDPSFIATYTIYPRRDA
jgi:hypothetical protein